MYNKQKLVYLLESIKSWCREKGDEELEECLNDFENELNSDDFKTLDDSGSNPPGPPAPTPPGRKP